MFAPKYETSSDIVTNKEVAQSNQKKRGSEIMVYMTWRQGGGREGGGGGGRGGEGERERERVR